MWGSLLYGWLVLTNIATTGATWYASPPTRWQIHAVDEIEILLGGSERCIATATNETGYQAAPMEYVESIRGTNGMMTVTNALTWQLASRGMLTSNDAAMKAAVPFYVQTNSLPSPATNWFAPWTFTGMVDSLGIGFSNWPYQVEFTNYEDRYKVLNFMEWTWRAASNAPDSRTVYQGHGRAGTWTGAYAAATSSYVAATNPTTASGVHQHVKGAYWSGFYTNYTPGEFINTSLGSNYQATVQWMLVTTESNYTAIATNLIVVSQGNTSDWINVVSTGNQRTKESGWVSYSNYPVAVVHNGAGTLGGKIYGVGGYVAAVGESTNVYSFDGTNWAAVNGYPKIIGRHGVSVLGSYLYGFGGYSSLLPQTNVYSFDGTDWTEVAGLPEADILLRSGVLAGKLYAFGGSLSTNALAFDGSIWTHIPNPPSAERGYGSAVCEHDEKLYSIGGGSISPITNVYYFNGTVWTETVGLPAAATSVRAVSFSNEIYVAGNDQTNVYVFDGALWREIEGLPGRIQSSTMAVLGDHIYVIGGQDGSAIKDIVYKYTYSDSPSVIEASGIYKPSGANQWACDTNGMYLFSTNGGYAIFTNTTLDTNQSYLTKSGSPIGTWTAVNFTSGGTTSTWESVVDPSGTYTDKTNFWERADTNFFVYAGGDDWVIYSAMNLVSNDFYFTKSGTVTGSYSAVNFYTTNTYAEYELVPIQNPVDPSGTYTHAGPAVLATNQAPWTGPSNWVAVYDGGSYYITTNAGALSPAWTVVSEQAGADTPGLEYPDTIGGGITGTVTAVYDYDYGWVDVFQTYTNAAGETNFYECWLTKVGSTNTAYVTPEITNTVRLFVFGTPPTIADSNVWHDQSLNLTNGAWQCVDTNAASTNPPLIWFGGTLSTPPADFTVAPTNANETKAEGFMLDGAQRFLFDWNFLYCTNRYW